MKSSYVIIYLGLIICACSKEQTKLPIDYINTERINVDVSPQEILLSDLVKEVKYIPLSSDFLIGEVKKIEYYNTKFYLMDQQAKVIGVFGLNGEFLYQIGDLGKGPGEYMEIQDFTIDRSTGNILIFDPVEMSLIFYDELGNYDHTVGIDFYINRMFVSDDKIFSYSNYVDYLYVDRYNLIISTLEGEIIQKLLPFDSTEVHLENFSSMNQLRDEIHIAPVYGNIIYHIDRLGGITLSMIDYGFDPILESELSSNENELKDYLNVHARILDIYVESNKFRFFNFYDDYSTLSYFLNKQTNKSNIGAVFNNIELLPFEPMFFIDDATMVGIHYSEEIMKTKDYLELYSHEFQSAELNFFENNFNEIDYTSNPVLALYSLK